MKSRLIIFLSVSLFSANTALCNTIAMLPDTSAKPWRIKESAFIEKYGENKKTKEFIREWFAKKHTLTNLSLISAGAAVYFGLALIKSSGGGRQSTAIDVLFIIDPNAIGLFLASIFTVIFLIPLLTHSRKKLYLILGKNKKGENIPKRFRKKLKGV